MTTWEEPKLFDIPPDRRIRSCGVATVTLEVTVTVEVDLDRLDRIEAWAIKTNSSCAENWKSDPHEVEWAIGNAAWWEYETGATEATHVRITDVDDVRLPAPFTSFAHLVEEIANPVWEPLERDA